MRYEKTRHTVNEERDHASGLGPGSPGALTREAWDWLEKTQRLYLRTQNLPLIADLPKTLELNSFDAVFEAGEDVEAAYAKVIETILALGEAPEGVTYAVPGHPCVGEATCPEIIKRAREAGIPVRVIDGLSFLEPTFRALEKGPFPNMVLMDALTLAMRHTPGFPPSSPAVVTQTSSRKLAADVKTTLRTVYPVTTSCNGYMVPEQRKKWLRPCRSKRLTKAPITGWSARCSSPL